MISCLPFLRYMNMKKLVKHNTYTYHTCMMETLIYHADDFIFGSSGLLVILQLQLVATCHRPQVFVGKLCGSTCIANRHRHFFDRVTASWLSVQLAFNFFMLQQTKRITYFDICLFLLCYLNLRGRYSFLSCGNFIYKTI
jgi:hypothetical protein